MVHIKKVQVIKEARNNDFEEVKVASKTLEKMHKGFAICVFDDDMDKFIDIVKKYDPDTECLHIDIPKKPEKLYFILIGNRLLNSDKPKIGNHELEVYTPSFPSTVNEEALPRGTWDEGNDRALKSWAKKGPETEYNLTTKVPLDIKTTDDMDIAKLKMLFYKYDIKFDVNEFALN